MSTTAAKRTWRPIWTINTLLGVVGLFLASCIMAPQLLAFPYVERIGASTLYAERPIDRQAAARVLARADARLRTSPLYTAPVGTRVFLTSGGWRWRVLSVGSGTSFGLTRPVSDLVSDAVILNHGSLAHDRFWNGKRIGTRRTLSGVIAHERTHVMVRRHLGLVDDIGLPRWISEGYADHVAGESTLRAEDVARLRAQGRSHMAIFYYESRQRVEAALKANGRDVDALLHMR